jgi:twinkle protein
MSERKDFRDFGIDIPHGATGEVRAKCPQCTPSRKPANQRKRDLAVNVAEGVFYCHHCSWQGSLGSGAGSTGSSNPAPRKPRTGPAWEEPRPLPAAATPDLWGNAVAWFGERGIPEPVIARMHVTAAVEYCPVCDDRVGHVLFPFYAVGDHVNTKHRCGKKHFRMERGAKRILYNLDCVSDVIKFQDDVDAPLVIVEGEIDALSVMAAGIDHVVSVPDGAPAPHATNYSSKFDFLSHAEHLLQQVRQIVIAVDGDEPGRKLQHELARRLGPERCSIVTWDEGIKDANECLVVVGPGYLRSCIESAQPIPVKGIYTGNELAGELRDLYRYGVAPGYDFGVAELDGLLSIKTGYISVWVGIPSHGKSTALDQLLVWQAQRHGNRAALFSPEQQPLVKHQQHLIEQYTGKPFHDGPRPRMSESEMLAANNWVSEHFSFILPEDTSIRSILELARTQVYRRGVKVIVVDPWNELEHARERHQTETEYISEALSLFRAFARTHDVHFVIVAHPTKMRRNEDGSEPVPSLWDIAGSAHFRNKADIGVTIWRDLQAQDNTVEIHVTKMRFSDMGKLGSVTFGYEPSCKRLYSLQAPQAVSS